MYSCPLYMRATQDISFFVEGRCVRLKKSCWFICLHIETSCDASYVSFTPALTQSFITRQTKGFVKWLIHYICQISTSYSAKKTQGHLEWETGLIITNRHFALEFTLRWIDFYRKGLPGCRWRWSWCEEFWGPLLQWRLLRPQLTCSQRKSDIQQTYFFALLWQCPITVLE